MSEPREAKPMRKEIREIPYLIRDGTTLSITMEVDVDEEGEAWLTPAQARLLEHAREAAGAGAPR